MMAAIRNRPRDERVAAAYRRAAEIADEDVAINQAIGRHGLKLIEEIAARKKPGERVNVLTHCNAGWLATVDWGTATAPIYMAHDKGVPIHVWADETRPRNQGASLTAWELGQHGVPHTVIPDNTGGHLMQHGMVDIVIVGTDRVTAKATSATRSAPISRRWPRSDNNVPFYVALPSPTIDFTVPTASREIPIEERSADEVATMTGAHRRRPHRDRADRARRLGGGQLRFRRDAGAARHRADHRARRARGDTRGARQGVSRARRRLIAGHPIGSVGLASIVRRGMLRRCIRIVARLPVDGRQSETALKIARGTRGLLHALGFCGQRTAAAVRPPRRSRGARRRRRNLDRRDQILGRRFPRRPEMDGLPRCIATGCSSPPRSRCRATSFRTTPA